MAQLTLRCLCCQRDFLTRRGLEQLQFVCKNLVLDGPENRKAALIGSMCTRCCLRREQFADTIEEVRLAALRTTSMMIKYSDQVTALLDSRRGRNDGTMGKIEEIKDKSGFFFQLLLRFLFHFD